MRVIRVRNVHRALPEALYQLRVHGADRDSRNGPVRKFSEPVTTVYEQPNERVLFWAERDANPFFHLYESLWMLGGRNDVEPLARIVERMRSFSDDGVTFHGAYGYRWRRHFVFDQIATVIQALKANPDDRRQVVSMWDARTDLGRQGKDLPCNLQALFSINDSGALDMLVTNRSNDLIWGAYGANAVHFSFLLEYVAAGVGVPVGVYRQVSNNLHAYKNVLAQVEELADRSFDVYLPATLDKDDPYTSGEVEPLPLVRDFDTFNRDLELFLVDHSAIGFKEPFFRKVVVPMMAAHTAFQQMKGKGLSRYNTAYAFASDIKASDWRKAAQEWIERRRAAFLRANDDGVVHAQA